MNDKERAQFIIEYHQKFLELGSYAEVNELVEALIKNGQWEDFSGLSVKLDFDCKSYRWKRKRVMRNGVEVLAPRREPLNYNEKYWMLDDGGTSQKISVIASIWENHKIDLYRLKHLGIFSCADTAKEEAEEYYRACLKMDDL